MVSIGDRVIDDLTGEEHMVKEFIGNGGWIIDSDYLEGYRFEWELTILNQEGNINEDRM